MPFGLRVLFINHFLQPVIPVLPELPNHWAFKELPQRNAFMLALAHGWHTDAPFVVEDMGETIFFYQSDRVEVA